MASQLLRSATVMILLSVLIAGCARRAAVPSVKSTSHQAQTMGYSIQAGAFRDVNNAVRLTRSLEDRGLQAFYFAHSSGFYKVRFGNYPSRDTAYAAARTLRDSGIIDAFMIVSPGEYASARGGRTSGSIRDDLARTAQSFIGIPYQWGSSSPGDGLDCSGLVLAVYQLNGLNVPRTSREQYSGGTHVHRRHLEKGDLVFFSTSGSGHVSHVGIYIGENFFIHAPGTGKTICTESLSSDYFRERFVGACTYLQ